MKANKFTSRLMAGCVLLLQACGAPHIRPAVMTDDIGQYAEAYIANVEVTSVEQNIDSLEANKRTKDYATQNLEKVIKAAGYKLVAVSTAPAKGVLAFNLNFRVVYGSRSARYWGGFGAGKGSVNSTLEIRDSLTKEIKYSVQGASDLSVGGFGGSMEDTIRENADRLLDAFLQARRK
jgi:hypothetical protein